MTDLDRVPELARAYMVSRKNSITTPVGIVITSLLAEFLHAYLTGELDAWLANSNPTKEI